jgi:thiol-disulfide isomerase/thioredoxin
MTRRSIPVLLLLLIVTQLTWQPAWAQRPALVRELRAAIDRRDFTAARSLLDRHREAQGKDPAWLEALSWMGRGKLAAKAYTEAERYATETREAALELLRQRKLDDETSLPLALGASIEVQSQVLDAQGQKSEAVAFLQQELKTWYATSIRTRIQKNLHLISLVGKKAPALSVADYLGVRPEPLPRMSGKPVLLFFWAHWCGDCKQQGPVVAKLQAQFAGKGLRVYAPTQHYGYAANGADATKAQETLYIDQVRRKYYPTLANAAVPLSEENFKLWGASTTPTLALIDRQGIVQLYHPGRMSYEELLPLVEAAVAPR